MKNFEKIAVMKKKNVNRRKDELHPDSLKDKQRYLHKTQGESNHLAFDWMRVLLIDNLDEQATSQSLATGTTGMEVPLDTVTVNNEASDSARSKPYPSISKIQSGQECVFVKGKCDDIAEDKKTKRFRAKPPKPYPVLGSEAYQLGTENGSARPDFHNEFHLYATGKLPLKFLYLIWGKNLGTYFKKLLFDIICCYKLYGRNPFKKALQTMMKSLNINPSLLPEKLLEKDLDALAALAV